MVSPVEYGPRETIDSVSTCRQRICHLLYTWAELQPSVAVTFTRKSKGFGTAGVRSNSSSLDFVLRYRLSSSSPGSPVVLADRTLNADARPTGAPSRAAV